MSDSVGLVWVLGISAFSLSLSLLSGSFAETFISLNAGTGPFAIKSTVTGFPSTPLESIATTVTLWLPGVKEAPSVIFS